jgi:S1-C subfamily serine protease
MKSEVTGTVIDSTGLTVLALSQTDPSAMIEQMMGDDDSGRFSVQVSDLRILDSDGTEIPGRVVLRDRDLDLAFVRPIEPPKQPAAYVDLASAANPGVVEPVFTLNRLGKVAGRSYAVSIERITSVVERPRRFYVLGNDLTQTALGSPAFTESGQPVGLVVLRSVKSDDESGGFFGMLGGMNDSFLPIVVPAGDILEVAKQAPATADEVKEIVEEESPSEDATEEKEESSDNGEPADAGQPAEGETQA